MATANVTSANRVFDGFWDKNEGKILASARVNGLDPYRLISIGTVPCEKANRVFASIIGCDTSDVINKIESTSLTEMQKIALETAVMPCVLPGIDSREGLKANAKQAAYSIVDLLSKGGNNVVVDTIGMKVYTHSKSILELLQTAGLGKTMQLEHIKKRNWEQVISKALEAAVQREMDYYKK